MFVIKVCNDKCYDSKPERTALNVATGVSLVSLVPITMGLDAIDKNFFMSEAMKRLRNIKSGIQAEKFNNFTVNMKKELKNTLKEDFLKLFSKEKTLGEFTRAFLTATKDLTRASIRYVTKIRPALLIGAGIGAISILMNHSYEKGKIEQYAQDVCQLSCDEEEED